MRHAGSAGFTLLELLVVLVVFGMLMVGLTQGTRFGLAAWNRQTATIESSAEIDGVDRALRRLIEQMDPGTPQSPPLAAGTADRFSFTSDLPLSSTAAIRRADMTLQFARGRLVLLWTPHMPAQRTGPAPPPREEVLLTGLDGVAISYWPRPPGNGWQAAWSVPALPEMVRIHLAMKGRRWPDIIAAPAASEAIPGP